MRIAIDDERCTGALNCLDMAPGAFRTGRDGRAAVVEVPVASATALREAVENCPTGAISVEWEADEGS